MSVRARGAVVAVLCMLSAALPSAARSPGVDFGPVPAWVQPVTADAEVGAPAGGTQQGEQRILEDQQVRVSTTEVSQYRRSIKRLAAEPGTFTLRTTLPFQPKDERITLHGFWRTRGKERINLLRPESVVIVDEEADPENHLFDSTQLAQIDIGGLQDGDVVELAYTSTGRDPVGREHYAQRFQVGRPQPTEHFSLRLLWLRDEPLFHRAHGDLPEPTLRTVPGGTELRWEALNVPAVPEEEHVPQELFPLPWLEVSSFTSWEQVVAWALPLYPLNGGNGPRFRDLLRSLRSEGDTEGERFLAATRLVQDELRTVGIETPASSAAPHPPETILARGFGDGKDKALLLAALLHGLGIDAAPALVNEVQGTELDARLPAHSAFNRLVVWARVGGKEIWVDPAKARQGGDLDHRVHPPFRRALIVRPGETGLVDIPYTVPPGPHVEVEEAWEVREGGEATLRIHRTYRGWQASQERWLLGDDDPQSLVAAFHAYDEKAYPGLRSAGPLELRDDPNRNILEFILSYELDGFWEEAPRALNLRQMHDLLPDPGSGHRIHPFRLEPFFTVRHRITVNEGTSSLSQPEAHSIQGPGWTFTGRTATAAGAAFLEGTWTSTESSVPPAQLPAHRATRDRVLEASTLRVSLSEPEGVKASGAETPESSTWLLLGGGAVLSIAVLGAWKLRRRGPRP